MLACPSMPMKAYPLIRCRGTAINTSWKTADSRKEAKMPAKRLFVLVRMGTYTWRSIQWWTGMFHRVQYSPMLSAFHQACIRYTHSGVTKPKT